MSVREKRSNQRAGKIGVAVTSGWRKRNVTGCTATSNGAPKCERRGVESRHRSTKGASLTNRRPPALPDGGELADLATRIRRGEASAEEALVDLFYERVRLVALFRTGKPDAARELAQDVLMAVVTALRHGDVRDTAKLTAFVYGTARNHVNNYFRADTRRPVEDALLVDYPAPAAPDPLEDSERTALVREALRTLDSADRKILLLTLVDGLKPGEIARRLGLSDEVVRARKSRAIKKVAAWMNKLSRT
jgi:RNA polymerase sigma-70 factor, ECF subfamily